MRRVLYILAVFILTVAMLEMPVFGMNYSVGLYGGFMPSMGGNLNSSVQASEFQSKNGRYPCESIFVISGTTDV